MADNTNIEWCDSTFNPWIGCTRVSPACDDCYAARSTPARTLGVAWGPGEPRRPTSHANWQLPGQWQRQAAAFQAQHGRRRRVFCASLADWLDNEVPSEWLVMLLHQVHSTPDLDWLLLTKRIGNWQGRLVSALGWATSEEGPGRWPGLAAWIGDWLDGRPPRNVWVGSTVVDQPEFDRDFPKLQRVPAAVRFLSVEPMLGPIQASNASRRSDGVASLGRPALEGLHWVICGGESGPKARPMHPDWARSLRDQCAAAGVPFLFKQWGEWVPADDDCGNVVPATEIVGDVQWQEGKRVQVQWLSPNNSIVGHSFARLGKKAAGRQLDGLTHDGFPATPAGVA